MKFNERVPQDVTRHILSGKDGALLDEVGDLLATVTSFQAQVTISNASYNPIGSALTGKHLLSYEVNLTLTETVVETSKFMQDLYDMMRTGIPVAWTFQSVMRGYDDNEERVIYRYCVPDGSLNLQNITVGELWTRDITLAVNSPPELQTLLRY